ncbi:PadR family transcriptional regulator [Bosea massiliensis]|uniref:PadR family transcriptional regulator n=1 Tax=Bosea massiliensis TaxID=151419 RepID=A0ABW0NYZ1_9HYPH
MTPHSDAQWADFDEWTKEKKQTRRKESSVSLLQLFRSDKASTIALSGREIAVLEAIRLNPTGICAADILTLIEEQTGKQPRLATVYDTILGLEKKNLIRSSGISSAPNGGRPRKLFELTEIGQKALDFAGSMAGAIYGAASA